MNIKIDIKHVTFQYLLDLCIRKIWYLLSVVFFAAMMSMAYQYFFRDYVVSVSYYYKINSNNTQLPPDLQTRFPGIQLSRWQYIVKSLTSYSSNHMGGGQGSFAESYDFLSKFLVENTIKPILVYTKSEMREYSQLTAQGVLEKNNVIGFVLTTSAPSKDEAIKLNFDLQRKLAIYLESFIIYESLHLAAPWLWDAKLLDQSILISQNKINELNADIDFLNKLSKQRPEILAAPYVILDQDHATNFAYLPLAIQLNSKLYQLELAQRNHISLFKFKNQLNIFNQILFDNNDQKNINTLSYENLKLAIEKINNPILVDVQKKIYSEVIFLKKLEPILETVKVQSSFKLFTIILNIIFALIIFIGYFILSDRKVMNNSKSS